MIQPADAQQLISKWWFAYDNALFDEWPEMWTSDAHFSCRTDTGKTNYEEFVNADASGRDAVLEWQTEHRLGSPHPLRHGGENVHLVDPGESTSNFRSYIRVQPDRRRLALAPLDRDRPRLGRHGGRRSEDRRPQRRARHRGIQRAGREAGRPGVTTDVEVALAVLDVLAKGDPDAADHVLDPHCVLWHNDGNGEVPARQGFAGARAIHELVDGLEVDVLLAEEIPGGAVMRFEVRGTVKRTGNALCARNCMFATVVDGRITRVDEYVDPSFGPQLGL